jgi:hypothetical protein
VVSGHRHAPAALYPPKRPGTHCTESWLGPMAGLDRGGKSRPQPVFDPRTVQSVASLYTDWATPAHILSFTFQHTVIGFFAPNYLCLPETFRVNKDLLNAGWFCLTPRVETPRCYKWQAHYRVWLYSVRLCWYVAVPVIMVWVRDLNYAFWRVFRPGVLQTGLTEFGGVLMNWICC